jgi:hypothetical protein
MNVATSRPYFLFVLAVKTGISNICFQLQLAVLVIILATIRFRKRAVEKR